MIGRAPRVAEALAHPHNNFGLLRLVMAVAVVISHAFSVTDGRVEQEPCVPDHRLHAGRACGQRLLRDLGFSGHDELPAPRLARLRAGAPVADRARPDRGDAGRGAVDRRADDDARQGRLFQRPATLALHQRDPDHLQERRRSARRVRRQPAAVPDGNGVDAEIRDAVLSAAFSSRASPGCWQSRGSHWRLSWCSRWRWSCAKCWHHMDRRAWRPRFACR